MDSNPNNDLMLRMKSLEFSDPRQTTLSKKQSP